MADSAPDPRPGQTPENVVANLKKEYMVVSKSRTHLVYAYLTLALVLGIGVGIGYVASNTGSFISSDAASETKEECYERIEGKYEQSLQDCKDSYGPNSPARNNMQYEKCKIDAAGLYTTWKKECDKIVDTAAFTFQPTGAVQLDVARDNDCEANYFESLVSCQQNFTDATDYFGCMEGIAIERDVCLGVY